LLQFFLDARLSKKPIAEFRLAAFRRPRQRPVAQDMLRMAVSPAGYHLKHFSAPVQQPNIAKVESISDHRFF
jgi:hypothetical protein